VGYEKFQFHERFAMMVNDFKDHNSVLCSRLIGTVCHVNLFERVRLVEFLCGRYLYLLNVCGWRVGSQHIRPADCVYMCGGSWTCPEVWLL